jgi:hypothetical protein
MGENYLVALGDSFLQILELDGTEINLKFSFALR